jgi:hypothetical protein
MRGSSQPPPEATEQGGLFTARQAAAAGISTYRQRNLLRQRRWIVVLGSVYAESSVTLSPVSLARAAQLAAGTGSVVSHTTGARLRGLAVPVDPEVHVIVGLDRRLRVPGLRTHRVPVEDSELDVVEGVLTTDLTRTVVDCLLWLPEEAGRALMTTGLREGRLDVATVRRALARCGPRHGIGRAWSVLADVASGAHSEGEVLLHKVMRRGGITGWRANVEVHDPDGLVGIVDVAFDGLPLVVELDGRAFHIDDERFERDRSRQNRLLAAGYVVLRFTWRDLVTDADGVVAQIRRMVERLTAARTRPA